MTLMKHHSGFTLIELMVVISIIAILAALGLASFTNARRNAADAAARAQVQQIASAAEQYRLNVSLTDLYGGTAAVGALVSTGGIPAGYTYSTGAGATIFCVMSPDLLNTTSGNCNACAAGVATFQTTGTAAATNFCAKNRQ